MEENNSTQETVNAPPTNSNINFSPFASIIKNNTKYIAITLAFFAVSTLLFMKLANNKPTSMLKNMLNKQAKEYHITYETSMDLSAPTQSTDRKTIEVFYSNGKLKETNKFFGNYNSPGLYFELPSGKSLCYVPSFSNPAQSMVCWSYDNLLKPLAFSDYNNYEFMLPATRINLISSGLMQASKERTDFPGLSNSCTDCLNDKNLKYLGEKEIIGRKCNQFNVDLKTPESNILNQEFSKKFLNKGEINFCLDKQSAIPLELTINMTYPMSENYDGRGVKTQGYMQNLKLTYLATSLDFNVNEKEFNLPQGYKTPDILEPTPAPTAEWDTYVNSKYGYSLKYPSDWQISSASTNDLVSFYSSSASANITNIQIVTELLNKPFTSSPTENNANRGITDWKRVTIDNVASNFYKMSNCVPKCSFNVDLPFDNGKKTFSIWMTPNADLDILKKLYSSFIFSSSNNPWKIETKSSKSGLLELHVVNQVTKEDRMLGKTITMYNRENGAIFSPDLSRIIYINIDDINYPYDANKYPDPKPLSNILTIYSIPDNKTIKQISLSEIKQTLPQIVSEGILASLNYLAISPNGQRVAMTYGFAAEKEHGIIIIYDLRSEKIFSPGKGIVKEWTNNSTLSYETENKSIKEIKVN